MTKREELRAQLKRQMVRAHVRSQLYRIFDQVVDQVLDQALAGTPYDQIKVKVEHLPDEAEEIILQGMVDALKMLDEKLDEIERDPQAFWKDAKKATGVGQ